MIVGVFNTGEAMLSVSQSGHTVLWSDAIQKKDISAVDEPISKCAMQISKRTPGLLQFMFTTHRGNVIIMHYNQPVLGRHGAVNEFAFSNPPQHAVIADSGLTTFGDTSLVYLATGKGQLALYSMN